jgi:hypothetical protein
MDWQVLGQRPEQRQMDVLLVAGKKEEVNDLNQRRPRGEAQAAGHRSRRLHRPERLRAATAAARWADHRPHPRGRLAHHAQHPQPRHHGLHARHRERRQPHHRGDPAHPGHQPARRPRPTSAAATAAASCPARSPTSWGRWSSSWLERSSARSTSTSRPAATREVTGCYVSGGTANIRALLEAVERRARVSVERFDPTSLATPDPKTVDQGLLTQRASQAVVSFGLALRKDREKAA